jgi:diguanylate cyclase (GGDEF)-like protein
MHHDKQLGRRLTRTYVAALALIALLSGAVHLLLDSVIASQANNASIINIAGRQRMLSQRIGMSAMAWVQTGDMSARERMLDAALQMKRAHAHLTQRAEEIEPLAWLAPAVANIYFTEPSRLDARTGAYISKAELLALRRDQVLLAELVADASGPLLDELERAVSAFELQARNGIEQLRRAQRFVLIVLLVTLISEAFFIFRPLVSRVLVYAAQLVELATRDGLTTLHNRRSFLDLAQNATQNAQRDNRPCTVVMFDIDHFKRINDTEGHSTGDAVLRRFADVLQRAAKPGDLVARLGGEEFVMLLQASNELDGIARAEAVREQLRMAGLSETPVYTVSAGVAQMTEDEGLSGLLRRADDALYCAKRAGRDQIASAPAHEADVPMPALV